MAFNSMVGLADLVRLAGAGLLNDETAKLCGYERKKDDEDSGEKAAKKKEREGR